MSKIPSVPEALLRMYVSRSRHDRTPGVAIVIPDDGHKAGAEALVAACVDLGLRESEAVIVDHVDPSLTTGSRLDDGRYVLLYQDPQRS